MVAKVRKPRVVPHVKPSVRSDYRHLSTLERREETIEYIRNFDKMNHFKHVDYEMFGGRVEIK